MTVMLLITFYSLVCVYLDPTDVLRQKLAGQWTEIKDRISLWIINCAMLHNKTYTSSSCFYPLACENLLCSNSQSGLGQVLSLHPVPSSQQCVGVEKEPGVPNYNTAASMQSSACTLDFSTGIVNLDASLNMYIWIYIFMYTVISHTI